MTGSRHDVERGNRRKHDLCAFCELCVDRCSGGAARLARGASLTVVLGVSVVTGLGSVANRHAATFVLSDRELSRRISVIAYGDMRFTDPLETIGSNPSARRALVARIGQERPDVVLLNGDVPWHGGERNDYQVYRAETEVWRARGMRIYPALGNHEFSQCEPEQCLANWWEAYPELNGRRWYSVELARTVTILALDSDASLLPESDQRRWLDEQIANLPATTRFVIVTLHHPPVADIQTGPRADHNPRPNEIALADRLKEASASSGARFIVIAGHVHNYERFRQDDVTYLVSGGGGAPPVPVDRGEDDLYQQPTFPNYHYVKFVLDGDALKAAMYRLADPAAPTPAWEVRDRFELAAKSARPKS